MLDAMRQGRWTADQLLSHCCKLTYERLGSYTEVARRLDLDRHTVARRVAASE